MAKGGMRPEAGTAELWGVGGAKSSQLLVQFVDAGRVVVSQGLAAAVADTLDAAGSGGAGGEGKCAGKEGTRLLGLAEASICGTEVRGDSGAP
jgi:hypothetical protein